MEKILLAVDGSAHSLRAAQYVVRLRRSAPNLELHVIHVEEAVPMRSHAFMNQEEIDKLYREQSEEQCANVFKYLAEQGVPYKMHLLVGDPGEKTVQTATSLGVDTIVVGSRGLNAVSSLVLGSVVSKIIDEAPMPVTVVK